METCWQACWLAVVAVVVSASLQALAARKRCGK
jgi:hypothetical protein